MLVVLEPLVGGRVLVCVVERTPSGSWRSIALVETAWGEVGTLLEALENGSGDVLVAERRKCGLFGVWAELAGTFRP